MKARYARVRAFQDAWAVVTLADCQKAFVAAGIYPFNEVVNAMQRLIHPTSENLLAGRASILSGNNVAEPTFLNGIPAYRLRVRMEDGSINDINPQKQTI